MQSDQIDKFAEALSKAQGQIKNPIKNRKVTVTTKSGGRYEFEYADFAAVIDAIKKPLSDNGIGYTQYVEQVEDKFRLVTTLMHISGQWTRSIYPLFLDQYDREGNKVPPTSQTFGSASTFMKRYALSSMVGVAADTDDDANSIESNQAEFTDKPDHKPAGRKPKTPPPSQIKEPEPEPPPPTAPIALPLPESDEQIEWVALGGTLLGYIKNASKDDHMIWLSLNAETIKKMGEQAPKVHKRLKAALLDLGIDKDAIEGVFK